jgi:hypothetical protein
MAMAAISMPRAWLHAHRSLMADGMFLPHSSHLPPSTGVGMLTPSPLLGDGSVRDLADTGAMTEMGR